MIQIKKITSKQKNKFLIIFNDKRQKIHYKKKIFLKIKIILFQRKTCINSTNSKTVSAKNKLRKEVHRMIKKIRTRTILEHKLFFLMLKVNWTLQCSWMNRKKDSVNKFFNSKFYKKSQSMNLLLNKYYKCHF